MTDTDTTARELAERMLAAHLNAPHDISAIADPLRGKRWVLIEKVLHLYADMLKQHEKHTED